MRWLSKDLWIIAAGFVAAMHVGKLPPAVPVLQAELGISLVQAGFLLSLVQVAGMCMALVLGSYTAKIGLKRCVLLGLSLLAFASFTGGFVQEFPTLLALRVVEGFGFLLITLSGPAFTPTGSARAVTSQDGAMERLYGRRNGNRLTVYAIPDQ